MNKRILGGLAAAAMLTGGLAFSTAGTVSAGEDSPVDDNEGQEVCSPLDSLKINTVGNPMTVPVKKSGYLITGYCYKAGTQVTYVKVSPTTSVNITDTIEKLQAISHYSFSFTAIPPVCDEESEQQRVCTKEPTVDYSEWIDGDFECDDTTVEQTRKETTTTYTWNGDEFDEDTKNVQKTETRDLTDLEQFACPILEEELEPEIEVEVVEVISPSAPTNRPPTQRPAPDVLAASSPAQAPPAEVSALPPVAPAAGLPVTGIDGTGITAIIALLLTSLGGAALFAARRRDASI